MTPEQLEVRIAALLDTCTHTVFNYTRRGLFDRDKLIVLTLLTFQILLRSGSIDSTEYDALCKGARSAAPPPITDDLSRCARPAVYLSPLLSAPPLVCRATFRQPARSPAVALCCCRWMSEGQWAAVDALTAVPGGWFEALLCLRLWPRCGCTHSCLVLLHAGFAHLAKDMEKNSDDWNTWCTSEGCDHSALPGDWARLSEFKQLLLLRALRPDRVATTLQQFCESVMGARYVNQEAFSPQAVLAESSRYAPLRPADMPDSLQTAAGPFWQTYLLV